MNRQDTDFPPSAAGTNTGRMRNSAAYALTLLTMVSFFNYLDRMVIAVLLEPIKRELSLSDSQMGLVAGFAFAMLYATMGLPLARIADRKSRVTLLSVCLVAWSAMTALTGLVRNFIELFIARMAVGVGEAGCTPAGHSLLGDLFSRERRPFAVSVYQAGGLLGQSAGLALAGAIAQVWGWRAALMAVGILGIPLAIIIYTTLREPPRAEGHAEAAKESMLATLKALIKRPPLFHNILGITIFACGSLGLLQWVPAFFIRLHGLNLAEVGFYTGLIGAIGGVFGTLFGGYVLTHLGPRDVRWELWWPAIMVGLCPLFMLPSFLIGDWKIALGIQLIGGFFGSAASGVALSALQSYAEPHRRATALAMLMLLSSLLGLGLGPVLIGVISDLLAPSLGAESLRYAMMIVACLPLWGAFHFWLAARSAKQWILA